MNLFTRNSPYYHFLKYLLFLLKHSVYEDVNRNLDYRALNGRIMSEFWLKCTWKDMNLTSGPQVSHNIGGTSKF